MPWVGALVGAAGSVIGGMMNKHSAGQQADAQERALKQAARAREHASNKLDDRHIWGAAQWLFPGLLPTPYGNSLFGPGRSPYGGGKVFSTDNPEAAMMTKGEKKAAKAGMTAAPTVDTPQQTGRAPVLPQGQVPITTPPPLAPTGPAAPPNLPAPPSQFGTTPPAPPGLAPGIGGAPGQIAGQTAGSTQPYAGELAMQHMLEFLQNPGQLSSTTYERQQEQANQGLNTGIQQALSGLAGFGINPLSGFGQALMQNAALNFGHQRNEAARDYSLAQEQLRRQDVLQGIQQYQNFLQTIFGLQGARSNAAVGGAYPQINNPVDRSGGLGGSIGTGFGVLGNALSNYFTQNPPGGQPPDNTGQHVPHM